MDQKIFLKSMKRYANANDYMVMVRKWNKEYMAFALTATSGGVRITDYFYTNGDLCDIPISREEVIDALFYPEKRAERTAAKQAEIAELMAAKRAEIAQIGINE